MGGENKEFRLRNSAPEALALARKFLVRRGAHPSESFY